MAGHGDAREFVLDTLVVAIAQVLLRLRGLVLLPLIVKLLGTASYGTFSQVIAVSGLAAALLAFNLHLALVRFMVGDRDRWGSIYVSLLGATAISVGVGGGLLALFADSMGAVLIGGVDGSTYLKLALALVFTANVRQINVNVYRATGRFATRSIVELVTVLGELLGMYVVIRLGYGLRAAFELAVVWELAAAVLTTAHVLVLTGWGRPDLGIVRDGLAFSLPLLPISLGVWALDRADRLVLNAYLGARAVGIYSASYMLATFVLIFQFPFQQTLFPKVSGLWDKDRRAAERYISLSSRVFLTVAIPFTAGATALAPPILAWLGNAEIAAESGRITFLLTAGVLLWGVATMIMQALYAARRTVALGALMLVGAAVNVVLNFALVPRWGVVAAAANTLVAYALVVAGLVVLVGRVAHVSYDLGYLAKCVAAAAAMAALLWLVAPRSPAALLAGTAAGAVVYALFLLALRAFSAEDWTNVRRLLSRRR